MSTVLTNVSEHEVIARAVQHYIDGAASGKGDDMKPAFHKDATIFGYAGADLFGGPIQLLFDWSDGNGPAKELKARIANIDLVDTVATVRLELDQLVRFTVHRLVHDAESRRPVENHEQGICTLKPSSELKSDS